MNKDLSVILKELKKIQPDPGYSKRSRLLILQNAPACRQAGTYAEKKTWLADILRTFYPAKLAFAAGVAVILLLVVSGSVYYVNNQLNQRNLVVRASEMNDSIQIRLNEIKYFLENNSQQLNIGNFYAIQGLLDKITTELKEASLLSLENKNLEESLQKIKSVQETLLQIDALLKNK